MLDPNSWRLTLLSCGVRPATAAAQPPSPPAADPRTTPRLVCAPVRRFSPPPARAPSLPPSLPRPPRSSADAAFAPRQFVVLLSAYAAATTDFGPADLPEDQWPGACTGVGTCEEKYARASQKVDNAGVDDILYRSRPGYLPTEN